MTSPSFQRFLTVTASTKRSPAPDPLTHKRGEPEVYLPTVQVSDLYPVDPELRARLGLDSPFQLVQVFAGEDGKDIQQGDWLTINGKDYPIKALWSWPWTGTAQPFRVLVLECLK